jgi:hypothetical protein
MCTDSFLFTGESRIENTTEDFLAAEFSDKNYSRKRAKENPKSCRECRQQKRNQKCDLDLCLACCASRIDEPCSVKDHEKEKSLRERAECSFVLDGGHRLVYSFLQRLNLVQYYDNFVENGFETLDSLCRLNGVILEDIGVTRIGHRLEILEEVKYL